MSKLGICTPSEDVCLAHSRPLVTSTRCEDGEHWHALASRLKRRVGKRLWWLGDRRGPVLHTLNEAIDEWARKESRR